MEEIKWSRRQTLKNISKKKNSQGNGETKDKINYRTKLERHKR
jgi:hypothetical protein